jgi:hypothetical protein
MVACNECLFYEPERHYPYREFATYDPEYCTPKSKQVFNYHTGEYEEEPIVSKPSFLNRAGECKHFVPIPEIPSKAKRKGWIGRIL